MVVLTIIDVSLYKLLTDAPEVTFQNPGICRINENFRDQRGTELWFWQICLRRIFHERVIEEHPLPSEKICLYRYKFDLR